MNQHRGDITPADAAYDERNRLVGYLSSQYPAHLTSDPVEPDWPVVCIHTPKGQMAWHIPLEAVGYFTHLSFEDNDWDGHTTQEKYKRLLRLYSNLVDSAQPKPNNHKERVMNKYTQSGNYVYGVDVGTGKDGTAYTVFRRPNWFERKILRVKWQYKLVHSEYEPSHVE